MFKTAVIKTDCQRNARFDAITILDTAFNIFLAIKVFPQGTDMYGEQYDACQNTHASCFLCKPTHQRHASSCQQVLFPSIDAHQRSRKAAILSHLFPGTTHHNLTILLSTQSICCVLCCVGLGCITCQHILHLKLHSTVFWHLYVVSFFELFLDNVDAVLKV